MKPIDSTHFRSGRKSTFFRYYLWILLLVFVLLSLFSIYIYYMSYKNSSARQDLSEQRIITQAIDSMDDSIYFINQLAASTSNNSDVISSCISPSLENWQRNFSVITALRTLVEDNTYLRSAYLYEHTKGYLLTSEGEITTLSSFYGSATILYCLSDSSSIILEEESNRYCSRLIQDGQKLFLAYDFVYSSKGPMNTLILELNKDELLSNFLSSSSLNNYYITIQGNKVNSIYSSENESGDKKNTINSKDSITVTSSYTKWSYTLTPKVSNTFSIMQMDNLFLPLIFSLLFISLVLSYFITCEVYAPIQDLTKMINKNSTEILSENKPQQNEIKYLENAYQQLISEKNQATEILEKVRPEIEQRLFINILNGQEYTSQELDKQLKDFHSNFRVNGKYQILLIQISRKDLTDPLEKHLYIQYLSSLANQIFPDEWGEIMPLPINDLECTLLVQYPSDFSIAHIKRIVQTFQNTIKKQSSIAEDDISFATGNVCNSLPEIIYSYRDAKNCLRYESYYHQEYFSSSDLQAEYLTRNYFLLRIQQFKKDIDQGEITLADELIKHTLKELYDCDLTLQETKGLCEKLLDTLVEETLGCSDESSENNVNNFSLLYQKLREAKSKKELKILMQNATANLADLFSGYQKNQHRLIARAKEYIADQYSNSSLSITEIAKAVGCSSSYLSNIFTKFTDENLISYLNSYRVNVAKDLLANSKILIKDIGYKTGFNTVQNFNRVFKKNTGMTPNEYRKKFQNL